MASIGVPDDTRPVDPNPVPSADLPAGPVPLTDEDFDDLASPQPLLPPPSPAKAPAVKRLEEALQARGYPDDVARVVARSIVDPAAARRELLSPSRVRVQGGATLEVIRVDVWAHAVAPFPSNPRESGHHRLPIQDADSLVLRPPEPLAGTTAVLTVEAPSRERVAASQNLSSTFLVGKNPYMKEIEADGVLVPVMAVPVRIRHADGTPDVSVLVTADGSSRVASCHDLLGIRTSDAAYVFAQDSRRLLTLIGEVRTAVERLQNGLGGEVPAVRALTVPAQVVVGCDDADLRRALQGYVGMQHVSHPTEWGATGEIDAKADAVLVDMRDDGVPAHLIGWYAGTITPDDARAFGIDDHLDQRVIDITACVRDHRRAAGRGIRRVDRAVKRVWVPKLAEVCADLGLRPARGAFLRATDAQVARQSLQEILQKAFKEPWHRSARSPEELRDVALRELEAQQQPGPAGLELVMLASYWLITRGILRPLYYRAQLSDGREDRRLPHVIAFGMLETSRGIHQLCQAVRDGRDGIIPRTVDADGGLLTAHHGVGAQPLTNDILRISLVPGEPLDLPPDNVPPPLGDTAAMQLRAAQTQFQKQVQSLKVALQAFNRITDHGIPLIEEHGWPIEAAQGVLDDIDEVRTTLRHWQMVATIYQHRSRTDVATPEQPDDEDV